jgi:polysaccharide pyruvyl transferase WcaK-like protein
VFRTHCSSGRWPPVVSVGACRLRSRFSRWFCTQALRLSAYTSVRDPWSRSFIETELGRPRPRLVPDAAFGLDRAAQPHCAGDTRTIGISPIAYGRNEYWPTRDHETALAYYRELVEFAAARIAIGDRLVLFSTDGPDWMLVEQMVHDLGARGCDMARVSAIRPASLAELLPLLSAVDTVVASRLHGVILSHLLHKPVLAISYDRKVSTHMQQVGHERYSVEFHEVSSATLLERFQALLHEADTLAEDLRTIIGQWQDALDRQYHALGTLMVASGIDHSRERP